MGKYKPSEIEKSLAPNCWKLSKDNTSAIILDEELDPLKCNLNGDGCVSIDTNSMTYIILSVQHLQGLIYLINKAKKAQNL